MGILETGSEWRFEIPLLIYFVPWGRGIGEGLGIYSQKMNSLKREESKAIHLRMVMVSMI